jgi:hypothetical protein
MESSVFAIHTPVHAPVDPERVTASSYALLAHISKGREAVLSYRFSLLSQTVCSCRKIPTNKNLFRFLNHS